MNQALSLLGNPQNQLRVIHITGTSGKTSTSYYVQGLLQACGFRTGMTVSPHILTLNERVQIDGSPLAELAFCSYLTQLLEQLMPLQGQMTYFEVITCLALWVFEREQVDYAIVEVGIGGTRDATNVLTRPDKIAIIGPIGLDHTDKLGSTLTDIAAQKAGILHPGSFGFVAPQPPEVRDVILAYAKTIGATVEVLGDSTLQGKDATSNQPPGMLSPPPVMLPKAVPPAAELGTWDQKPAKTNRLHVTQLDGVPAYQTHNWAMALEAVTYLSQRDGFALPEDFTQLRRITPPARFEWFTFGDHRVLLDGAHSPQKVTSLVEAMRAVGLTRLPTLATLSAAPSEKITQTIEALAPAVSRLIIPEFRLGAGAKTKVSAPAHEVAQAAADQGIPTQVIPNLGEAIQALLSEESDTVLITGSLYLAALVRPLLANPENPETA